MQFTPGDIIQDFEEPFVKNLNVSYKKSHCNKCFKGNIILRCAGCKIVYYCDGVCQKIDWKTAHKMECKLFAKSKTLPSDDDEFQIIRLIAYLKLNEASAKKSFKLYDGSER